MVIAVPLAWRFASVATVITGKPVAQFIAIGATYRRLPLACCLNPLYIFA
jgi:hypothetical protein